MSENRSIMKTGLIVAAALIVSRIIAEQLGAPEMVNNVFGVAWLYFIMPVFFGLKIAAARGASPYRTLLKDVFLFAVYTRLMVMGTYMLAYFLKWRAPRFSTAMGGNVGENITLVNGLLLIPLRNALIWVVFATIVGMAIGAVVLLLKRKKPAGTAAD